MLSVVVFEILPFRKNNFRSYELSLAYEGPIPFCRFFCRGNDVKELRFVRAEFTTCLNLTD